MEKTILGLGVVLVSASLLTACNTLKGAADGVESTAVGVGQTVTGTVVGAEKDIKATEKAVTTHHKAHKKAQHKKTTALQQFRIISDKNPLLKTTSGTSAACRFLETSLTLKIQ